MAIFYSKLEQNPHQNAIMGGKWATREVEAKNGQGFMSRTWGAESTISRLLDLHSQDDGRVNK